ISALTNIMATTYRKLQVFEKTSDFAAAVKVVESALVDPKPDQIRVKQIYAGVNATDVNITAGRYFTDGKVPYDIGFEALGYVDAIGSSIPANKFKVGQPVLVFDSNKSEGFAEYSYKTESTLIPIPDVKPEYLVSLISGLSASISLDYAGRVKAGDKVLITAAAGGTGQIAVQWAKQRGAYVIGTTSSEAKAKYLKELGADFVINYNEKSIDQSLKENFPGGVDVIWETIGGETFRQLFEHLSIKGRIVIIGSIHSYRNTGESGVKDVPIENLNGKILMGCRSINGFVLLEFKDEIAQYLPKIVAGIAQGTLKVQVDLGESSPEGKFFGVDQIYRAQNWLHARKNLGKVVVQLQNP
ncbi:Prostaglandin reductase 3, partial [Blomia tropicalis]